MKEEEIEVQWCRVHKEDTRPLPKYETKGAAGMDISAWLKDGNNVNWYDEQNRKCTDIIDDDQVFIISPYIRAMIPTGWRVKVPSGYELQLRPRSGNAIKLGLSFANCVGTIDSDYRGEVKVEVVNLSNEYVVIKDGMRIAQAVLARAPRAHNVEVEELDETERGAGGFGSTDAKAEKEAENV